MTPERIAEILRPRYPEINATLVAAVLAHTAMIATTGGGVSPALARAIIALDGGS